MGLKIKNVNIMGVYQFLGEGGYKKLYMGNCLERGLRKFAGGLEKNTEGVFFFVFFFWEGGGRVDTSMHTMI